MEFLMQFATLWHLKVLVAWVLMNCAPAWYSIWRNKRLARDPARDIEKYMPFVRNDTQDWSYLRCLYTHFFMLPRWVICFMLLLYALASTKVILLGCDIRNITERRKTILVENTAMAMRIFGFFIGCWEFRTFRPKVDYSKWLGPDWKPQYDGASMYVSNHTGYYDAFNTFIFVRPMPGFLAKHMIR